MEADFILPEVNGLGNQAFTDAARQRFESTS